MVTLKSSLAHIIIREKNITYSAAYHYWYRHNENARVEMARTRTLLRRKMEGWHSQLQFLCEIKLWHGQRYWAHFEAFANEARNCFQQMLAGGPTALYVTLQSFPTAATSCSMMHVAVWTLTVRMNFPFKVWTFIQVLIDHQLSPKSGKHHSRHVHILLYPKNSTS